MSSYDNWYIAPDARTMENTAIHGGDIRSLSQINGIWYAFLGLFPNGFSLYEDRRAVRGAPILARSLTEITRLGRPDLIIIPDECDLHWAGLQRMDQAISPEYGALFQFLFWHGPEGIDAQLNIRSVPWSVFQRRVS